MDVLDLRKSFTNQQYSDLRKEVRQRQDRKINFHDQDYYDFMKSDPRIQHIDGDKA